MHQRLNDSRRLKVGVAVPYDLSVRGGVQDSALGQFHNLEQQGHRVLVLGMASNGSSDAGIRLMTGRIVSLPINGSIARVAIPRDEDVQDVLNPADLDVVIVHEPALPLSQAVLRTARAATVGIVHAYGDLPLPLRLLARSFAPHLSRVEIALAVSPPAAQFARQYWPRTFELLPNGVALPPAQTVRREPALIAFVGRPEPRKGVDVLLAAFSRVIRIVPSARLVLAGDGDWSTYRQRATEMDLTRRVVFQGRVSEVARLRIYQSAAVVCCPSLGGESQGKVVLEALAVGAPVVASDIPGYASVITSGKHGLLAAPGNDLSLAWAMSRLLTDRRLATSLGAAGRALVQEEYSWATVIPRLQGHLQRACEIHLFNSRQKRKVEVA